MFSLDVQQDVADLKNKEFQPRMNTNIHEWSQGEENRQGIKIEKEIRVHSCSFVAEILLLECAG